MERALTAGRGGIKSGGHVMKLRHNGRGVRLYEGDVLTVLPSLAARGDEFDAVITDPPYSSGGQYRGDRVAPCAPKYYKAALANFSGDNRDQRSYLAWSTLWLTAARALTREGGLLCSFIDWRQLPTLSDAIQAAGWTWRGVLCWDRTAEARRLPKPSGVYLLGDQWAGRPPRARDQRRVAYSQHGNRGPAPRGPEAA